MPFYQQLNHLIHLRERVNLAFVGGKWCNANPLAERLLGADDCGKECQIAFACGENRPEIELYGITQACKYVGIILKRGGLLQQLLIVFRGELSLPSAVFIDVCHSVAAEIEPQSQVFRSQHVVQVGHGREVLGCQSAVERIESAHTVILFFDVGRHKTDVGRHLLEEYTGERPTQNGDAHLGILLG